MLSLNTLRTKFGVLLTVVIFGALIAFIFSLKNDIPNIMPDGQEDVAVGEVDGEEVMRSEFNLAYGEMSALMGDNNVNYDQSSQLIQAAWESILADRVYIPALEELGLVATDGEVEALLDMYKEYPMYQQFAKTLENQTRQQVAVNKYMNLVRNGVYTNSLMVNRGVAAANNTYNGRFVLCDYSSIADKDLEVSDSEISNYYSANLAKYKQTPYRTISYAHFEIEPSDADKKAAEDNAKAKARMFAATKNLDEYVYAETGASYAEAYTTADNLPSNESKALRAGKMYGPELQGDEWYASRVAKSCVVPESFELQLIILPESESQQADSLYTAAKAEGADFAALLPEAYQDWGERESTQLTMECVDALANVKANTIVKTNLENSIQIWKVGKIGKKTRHYHLVSLTVPVDASKATKEAIYKEVSEFEKSAAGSLENFQNAAKSVATSSMSIAKGSRNVPGLAHSLEVVRWANSANVGDVSSVFKLNDGSWVIAALTAVDNSEYRPLENVSSEIKRALIRQKKVALLKEKMQGATIEDIAANSGCDIKSFKNANASSYYNNISEIGVEPRVLGALTGVSAEAKGELLPLIEGSRGVYAIVVDGVKVKEEQTAQDEFVKAQAEAEQMAAYRALSAVREKLNIVDNTVQHF